MSISEEKAPSLNEKHSAPLRIWHWSSFLVVSALLITVLISSTLLKQRQGPPPPGQQGAQQQGPPPGIDGREPQGPPSRREDLQQQGPPSPASSQKNAIRQVRHTLWTWHKYFGFVLAGLLLFRIVLEFFQSPDEKFFGRIKNVRTYLKLPVADKKSGNHYYRVKLLYVAFYTAIIVMVTTGLIMAFTDDIDSFKNTRHDIQEVHGFVMYFILGFLFIHISGVVLGELGKFKGVVSGMINGSEL